MEYFYKDIEYIPNEKGIPEKVKCPLVDDFIENYECIETSDLNPYTIRSKFIKKENYREICEACPFHGY
jgi:hypothetical protein